MSKLSKRSWLEYVPPCWELDGQANKRLEDIKRVLDDDDRAVVVLDDDPTGVQTIHDIMVTTQWDEDFLYQLLAGKARGFFILTNSRSFPQEEAVRINRDIARNLIKAASLANRDFVVISRSDSTLRGHYPAEVDALRSTLQDSAGMEFDGEILMPVFVEGGRYTSGDIHLVEDSGALIPVGETEFARDASFGFVESDLKEWIREKTYGRVSANEVRSISLEDIRNHGPNYVASILEETTPYTRYVVNAMTYDDIEGFVLGLLMAEAKGKRFLYRTAASFVRARMGLAGRPLLSGDEIYKSCQGQGEGSNVQGGLVIVGSHVKKSTEQLRDLMAQSYVRSFEFDVGRLVSGSAMSDEVRSISNGVSSAICEGMVAVVYTSRDVVTAGSQKESLAISQNVSIALTQVVRQLNSQLPLRFIVAKGGITSSDIATKGLDIKSALVLGQIMPGIPVWKPLGKSRFPGIPYVVFPGNVGGPDALTEVVLKLRVTD